MGKVEVGKVQEEVWKEYWENYYMGPSKTQFLEKKTLLGTMRVLEGMDHIDRYSVMGMVSSYIDDAMEVAFNLGWNARKEEIENIHKELKKKRID